MTLYDTTVDTAVANSSHTQVVRLVGAGKKVLDVGCSTGYVARALVDNGCTVSGIEYNEAAGEVARPSLERLVIADLNEVKLEDAFAGERFDSIVFADVLEHLASPADVLRSSGSLLAAEGSIVISIPHVGHGSLRLALLQGRWRYRDTGLLDRTHIHFYTLDGLHELLSEAGLVATDIRAVVLDPLGVEVEVATEDLPDGVVDWVRAQPDAYTYQYVVSAKLGLKSDDDPSPVPVPAEPIPGVEKYAAVVERRARVEARDRELADESQDLRHKVLVARDNAIGLEGAAARARLEAERLRAEVKGLHLQLGDARAEIIETHERLRALTESIGELKATTTWRLGSLVLSPTRILRGGRK
ncbi:Methyltransferase domain-containing protein [Sanguibacter gelidistatuariae]|uniref:Methyltransferase domain-containing protein n=1 Tax=Sanguibacter gelidistatuariae TaxID=1814289 RepID=A0A1G6XUC1_9MICO|nr:class I SAM-dependent methyltransferase [Sanguibacter gelidistatuariae]SDD81581.1 Methyltransferase domain-containing protein [Sanguibacter gelidistatuariae]